MPCPLPNDPQRPCQNQAYLVNSILHSLDPSLLNLTKAAGECPSYTRLLSAIRDLPIVTFKSLPASDPLSAYKSIRDDISIHPDGTLLLYQCDRIIVPITERPRILELLHMGHSGITKTRRLARQLYYWPYMSRDIKDLISKCVACQDHLPHHPPLPLIQTNTSRPLESTSADLFSLRGKSYLAFADRFSGMVWADCLSSTTTSCVTSTLEKWFYEIGFPESIRTDGGPQFRGPFNEWCSTHNIIHETSSPYHPQSNGHGEAAVKTAKFLLDKVDANLKDFRSHLFAWRNTPRADAFSPSDLFYGRRQRSPVLPSLRASTCDVQAASSSRDKLLIDAKMRHDKKSSLLSPLSSGNSVLFTSPGTGWNRRATILRPRPDGLSYYIQPDDGSTETIRNRKFLRLAP